MNVFGWLQVILYVAVLLALVKPLGAYMARVYQGERTFLTRLLSPLERFICRAGRIQPDSDMG
jgi:K+-transporting ATPase ATPase A chain